jgi:hypothetical protein
MAETRRDLYVTLQQDGDQPQAQPVKVRQNIRGWLLKERATHRDISR